MKVRSDTGEYILTPGSFNLKRNQYHILVAEYEGSEPQQKTIKHGLTAKGITKEEVIASLGVPDEIAKSNGYDKFTYANREPKCYYFKDGTLKKAE